MLPLTVCSKYSGGSSPASYTLCHVLKNLSAACRRIANRESAQRVRHKRQVQLDQLETKARVCKTWTLFWRFSETLGSSSAAANPHTSAAGALEQAGDHSDTSCAVQLKSCLPLCKCVQNRTKCANFASRTWIRDSHTTRQNSASTTNSPFSRRPAVSVLYLWSLNLRTFHRHLCRCCLVRWCDLNQLLSFLSNFPRLSACWNPIYSRR